MTEALLLREPVSAGTHLAAFLWAVYGALILWRLCRGDRAKQLSTACFGLSMVILYGASGTYHALRLAPADLNFFRLLDHTAIYALIAGTYTPPFFVLLKGRQRTFLLSLIWALALAGSICKWTVPVTYYPLTVGIYLGMGYVGLLPIVDVWRAVGTRGSILGITGGVLYTLGAVLDLVGWPVVYPGVFGSHELLHVCVIGGTLCHFLFIVGYVIPHPRKAFRPSTEGPASLEGDGLALT